MINIIVVLPKLEDAKGVRGILTKNGFPVTAVCTTGSQALSQLDDLNDGIIQLQNYINFEHEFSDNQC